jgi:hypothetical protein
MENVIFGDDVITRSWVMVSWHRIILLPHDFEHLSCWFFQVVENFEEQV